MASPNQAAKREQIVAAAVGVLMHSGVVACTARAIADAGPLTKSALHYYFDDVDEIVDEAFRRLIDEYLTRIEKAAADRADPAAALWAAVRTYLLLGADRPGGRAPMLWFDYHVASQRRGDTATIESLTERGLALFTRLVVATGVDDPCGRASVLFSALIGTVVRESMRHRDVEDVVSELATATGIPAA